jgi:hypothetical protein
MHKVGEEAHGANEGSNSPAQGAGDEPLVIERLGDHHRVPDFKCRAKAKTDRVERFLHNQHRKYEGSRFARFFVACPAADKTKIYGYYCLSSAAIRYQAVGAKISGSEQKRVPGKIDFPVAKLGYMGKSDDCPVKDLGELLLVDAAQRLTQLDTIGVWGILLDAELGDPNDPNFKPDPANDKLVAWYRDRGFLALDEQPVAHTHTMFAKLAWLLEPD